MLTLLKLFTLKRNLLISLLIISPIHAAEEKKAEANLAEEVAEMATPEPSKPDREKEISTLIEKNIRGGEAVWLGNEDKTFLALYKENTWKETQGAILLLHDLGANADWSQLINPLRLTFPKKGWHTLSLQLPMVTTNEGKKVYLNQFDEAVSRVNAGIEFLKQKNVTNIAIVGHGIGSTVGVFYINQYPQAPVTALVAISLPGKNSLKPLKQSEPAEASPDPAPDPKEKAVKKQDEKSPPETASTTMAGNEEILPDRDLFAKMEQIKIPFLDIYAQVDHQDVIREALKRSELMHKTDNPAYSQWQVKGAGHYFRGVEDRLIRRLRGWLKNHAPGVEMSPSPSS